MRDIDWEQPLSEEDTTWVEAVGSKQMRAKLKKNQARFSAVAEEGENPPDEYDSMTLDELKSTAKARKEQDPDFDVSGVKSKRDLISRLREWDSAE